MLRILSLASLSIFLVLFSQNQSLAGFFDFPNRSHISIAGSSTVYPFAATISETFGRDTKFKTPIVESTGTGGGFKLFCSGVGYDYTDFSNASRPIKQSEIDKCRENGINNIGEIKIGYDGIVLANSILGENFSLTKKQIFLALANKVPSKDGASLVDNFYQKWSDIDKNLPQIEIMIYGPPPTSGTRDAFVELIMEEACEDFAVLKKSYPNKEIRAKKCHIIRNDGRFIEAGENDNLIVQKLKNNINALGIFGFSFLEENSHLVKSAKINNIVPSFENIVSGKYSVSRPLFIYFKGENIAIIDGMKEFILEIISPNTIGFDGYLLQKGLIPLTDSELETARGKVIKFL